MENEIFFKSAEKKKKSIGLIHRVYLTLLKNSRKYLASTKTKSEVRGGGKKPWKQKGTGNARAGSNRSPLWAGGGVIFGPKPRIVEKKINKKEKRLAILSAIYLKKNKILTIQNKIFDQNEESEITKTKNIVKFLKDLNLQNSKKILFILPASNKNVWLATRNLKNVEITTASCLNLCQLLEAEHILVSTLSFDIVNQTYGSQHK
jgi:large subunit ribosomal protein L4